MNNLIERIWKQGGLVNIEDLRGTAFQAEESAHTFRIRGVDESGEPLALTGTVGAVFLRADNTDVAITGTITDGAAEVTLPDECYDMPGRFGLTIYVTSDEQTVAVYAAIGSVCRTSSGVVSPETGEDVMDLINAIAEAVETIPASYTDLMAAVAPTYSTSALYAVGSYAWYSGKLYRCTTAITSGETWTSAHWTQANLGSNVSDLRSAVRIIKGPNLFDRTDYKENQRIDNLGRLMNATGYFVTHFIPVEVGKSYTKNSPIIDAYHRMSYYDGGKQPIADSASTANTTTAPTGAKYAAFCGKLEELSTAEFYLESAVDIPARQEIEKLKEVTTIKDFDGLFYRGGFNASQGYWIASTTNVVTPYDSPVWLNAGDEIYLTSYPTGVSFRTFWKETAEESFSSSSWVTSGKHTITATGNHWFEIMTQSDIADINDVRSLFRIDKYTSHIDYVCREETINQRTDFHVKSINHRGANRYAPENTLPAFELSAKLGWKYVETDVKSTSDGVLVLLHDATINRTARNADGTTISGDVNIEDITYEQALEYDFGIYFGEEYEGTKIPTLTDFLKLCRRKSLYAYLDFGSIDDSTIISEAISAVRRNGMSEFVTYAGRMTPITIVVSLDPKARVVVIEAPTAENVAYVTENLLTGSNEVVFDVQTGTYSDADIERLATAKIPAEAYTPNSMSDVIALDPYFTGITSDYLIAGKVLYNNGINYEAT